MPILTGVRPEQGLHQVEHLARLIGLDGVVYGLGVAPRAHHAVLSELRQMLRQGRLADFDQATKLTDGPLAVREVAEDRKATLVANRLEKRTGAGRSLVKIRVTHRL